MKLKSVSSLSEHKQDLRDTAQWLKEAFHRAGLETVEVIETAKHPVVYAEWLGAGPEAKTILVYGHYDVQPVDPLHLWETEPFEPTIRDNKLYARGASDDKGQTFMHVKAVEAMLKTEGKLPFNVKFLSKEKKRSVHRILIPLLNKKKTGLRPTSLSSPTRQCLKKENLQSAQVYEAWLRLS